MSEQLLITITARDGASQTFRAVADSAASMGQEISKAGDQSKTSFSDLTSELTTLGAGMTAVGGAITTAIVAPMALGTRAAFNQVRSVQQATVALNAYEKDARKVEQVLSDLVAYARSDMGILFQREDLFAAAQGLKIMGAETENLVEYVEIMSRSVGLGMTSWDELGRVIGRVMATGRLAGNEFDELTKAGFQLDESLRNAAITTEDLFDALDRGIPADAMAGQVATIDGAIIRLQSSIRELGIAILDIDRDTSTFNEGGLGDRMVEGLRTGREVMLAMVPAAEMVGDVLASVASVVATFVDGFLMLPGPVQTAGVAIAGLVGGMNLLGGAALMLIPRIAALGTAIRALVTLGTARAGFAALTAAISPVGLAIAGITAAVSVAGYAWIRHKQEVAETQQAYEDMEAAIASVNDLIAQQNLAGDFLLAERLRLDIGQVREIVNQYEAEIGRIGEISEMGLGEVADIWANFSLTGAGRNLFEHMLDTGIVEGYARDVNMSVERVLYELNMGNRQVIEGLAPDIRLAAQDYYRQMEMQPGDIAAIEQSMLPLFELYENPNIDVDALDTTMERLFETWREGGHDAEWLQTRLAALYDDITVGADRFDILDDASTPWFESLPSKAEALDWVTNALEAYNRELEKAEDIRLTELQADFIDMGMAVAGLDDALSRFNLSTLNTDAMAFAKYVQVGNDALSNTYRIIVSNTDALGQTVQQTADWIDSLAYAEDGWTRVHQLQADGFINEQQMNDVFAARTSILESNWHVQNDILTMQALQAPLMAELVAQQEARIHALSSESAEVQLVALAWMDSATAAQAMEIATMAATVAAGDLGVAGEQAFAGFIEGALAANPLLEGLLTDIGLVARDHEGNLIITTEGFEQAASEMELLTQSILLLADLMDNNVIDGSVQLEIEGNDELNELYGDLLDFHGTEANATADVEMGEGAAGLETMEERLADWAGTALVKNVEINVTQPGGVGVGDGTGGASNWEDLLGIPESVTTTVNAEDNASGVLGDIGTALDGLDGSNAAVTATADTSGADSAITGTQNNVTALDGSNAHVTATGDGSAADGVIASVSGALTTLDGTNANVTLSATDNASGVISGAQGLANAFSGTYVATLVSRYVTEGSPLGISQRHGGIPGYAGGGVLFEAGEAGPELLHFAGGGMALLPHHGLYEAPAGSYVSPSNTYDYSQHQQSGDTIELHIHGNVYGIDDLADGLAGALAQRRRGHGGLRA